MLRRKPIASAPNFCRRSAAFSFILALFLGLTPQAMYLSPLRGSGSHDNFFSGLDNASIGLGDGTCILGLGPCIWMGGRKSALRLRENEFYRSIDLFLSREPTDRKANGGAGQFRLDTHRLQNVGNHGRTGMARRSG